MLGVGIFHQLPHAVAAMPDPIPGSSSSLDWCMGWLMIGLLMTFFMLRMFHFHSHEPIELDDVHAHDHDHDHNHDHDHGHDHGNGGDFHPGNKTSWIGIFLGLSLHTLLDGVALAANVQADALHDHHGAFAMLGFGTFLGVVLHKPLDSLSITSLMAAGGWSPSAMRTVNLGYALMCPIGAGLFYFGIQQFSGSQNVIVAAALAMSAGVFICISLSDLLPEVQFHSHDRFLLSATLMAGVALAWGIGFLEPEHTHDHSKSPATHVHDHHHE
jgi:zinc and cadmium transporter